MLPGPDTVVGVHTHPLPLVKPTMLKPAGTVSVIVVGAPDATWPLLLTTIL